MWKARFDTHSWTAIYYVKENMLAGHKPSVHLIRQSPRAVEMAKISLWRNPWLCGLCSKWVCVCVCGVSKVDMSLSAWGMKGYLAAVQLFSDLHWIPGSGMGLILREMWQSTTRTSNSQYLWQHRPLWGDSCIIHAAVNNKYLSARKTSTGVTKNKSGWYHEFANTSQMVRQTIPWPMAWEKLNTISDHIHQDEFLQEQGRMTV